MRLILLPFLSAAMLAAGGCASPAKKLEKQMAKQEREIIQQNSRLMEEKRMRALNYGDVNSERGAEILVYDPNKVFDPSRSDIGTARTFGTGGTRTKQFDMLQKARTDTYLTRDYRNAKSNAAAEKKYATRAADARSKNTIPNVDKDAGAKAAATRELWDGNKVAATQDVRDGSRPYLGPESKKMRNAVDPKTLADWRSGGGEAVVHTGSTVERIGNLKQLSIEDVRELLNKNK